MALENKKDSSDTKDRDKAVEPRKNDKPADGSNDKKPPKGDTQVAKDRDKKPKENTKPEEPEIDPNADGYFIAFTKPWARVIIDGKDTGKVTPIAPAAKIPLKPGTHKVTFVVGDDKHTFSFKIEPGKLTRMAKQFQ